MTSANDGVVLVVLVVAPLIGVAVLLRQLSFYPVPAFSRLSLRRQARRMLRPPSRRRRLQRQVGKFRPGGPVRTVGYAIAFAALWLPLETTVGPLGDGRASEDFLTTLWQVVATVLGFTVVMVAFAFEAFGESGRRSFGGTLREFAQESYLVVALEFGLFALFVDGAVLFGAGHTPPGSWPGLWATVLSSITLGGVVVVVHRVLNLLDDRRLAAMRTQRVRRIVDRAMETQLLGQAAEVWLSQSDLPIARGLSGPGSTTPIESRDAGLVSDIRLGPLARWSLREPSLPGGENAATLPVMIGDQVGVGTDVLFLPAVTRPRNRRRLRDAIRIKAPSVTKPTTDLKGLLAGLHRQAVSAAVEGRVEEWRDISDTYELVLLGLPMAAAERGIPFEGAVLSPGWLGQGPVQEIRRYLYDELAAAVRNDRTELVGPLTYFPHRIAVEAARLGVSALADPMLTLYPQMYALANEPVS